MSYIGNQPTQVAFLTDTFSGNGSTTAFTTSVAPANTASVLIAISGVLQDPSTYSVSGNTLTFSAAPPTGTNNISARYLGIPASGVTTTAYRTQTEFTATAGQTTFTPPSYTIGFIQVYRNGVLLGSSDYIASNGTTVVLTSGATSGDLITTISFYVSSVLNAIPATTGSVGSTYLASNLTLGGTTNIQTGITFAANPGGGTQAVLNDYEVGTYTPTLTGFSGTYTATTNYVKIGRLVHVFVTLSGSGITGSSMSLTQPFNGSNYGTGSWTAAGTAQSGVIQSVPYGNTAVLTGSISSTTIVNMSWSMFV